MVHRGEIMQEHHESKPHAQVAHPKNTSPHPSGHPVGNGFAITALIVGIVAFISGWIPFFGLLAGIAAVVFGIVGLRKMQNKGMSITGIVTGGLAVLTGFFVTIATVIAIGGLSLFSQSIDEIVNEVEESNSSVQEQIDAQKDFEKGETAQFDKFDVTINSVQRNFIPGDSYSRAGEGKEFVLLNITVKNTTDKQQYVGPIYFQVNDGGLAINRAYATVDSEFESGDLSAGASTSGNVVYEVTKDATDLKLQYTVRVYPLGGETQTLVYTLAF